MKTIIKIMRTSGGVKSVAWKLWSESRIERIWKRRKRRRPPGWWWERWRYLFRLSVGDITWKDYKEKDQYFTFFFSFCFLKTFNSLCVDETWIHFWEKVVAGSLYKSWKPSISLTKISKKVLTWCINKLKSISFPRDSLKNNIPCWITHIHEIRKKNNFLKILVW